MTKKVYSEAYKERMVRQLMPPINKTTSQIRKEEGIPSSTFHTWIRNARKRGLLIPNANAPSPDEKWRNEDKLRMVIETYSMNEEEVNLYCRQQGIYRSDLQHWQQLLEHAFEPTTNTPFQKESDRRILKLQNELRYKEKALAEAAALLVLQKKVQAFWGIAEDE